MGDRIVNTYYIEKPPPFDITTTRLSGRLSGRPGSAYFDWLEELVIAARTYGLGPRQFQETHKLTDVEIDVIINRSKKPGKFRFIGYGRNELPARDDLYAPRIWEIEKWEDIYATGDIKKYMSPMSARFFPNARSPTKKKVRRKKKVASKSQENIIEKRRPKKPSTPPKVIPGRVYGKTPQQDLDISYNRCMRILNIKRKGSEAVRNLNLKGAATKRRDQCCVICHSKKDLELHLIYPDVEDYIKNVITLCGECHKMFHSNELTERVKEEISKRWAKYCDIDYKSTSKQDGIGARLSQLLEN